MRLSLSLFVCCRFPVSSPALTIDALHMFVFLRVDVLFSEWGRSCCGCQMLMTEMRKFLKTGGSLCQHTVQNATWWPIVVSEN